MVVAIQEFMGKPLLYYVTNNRISTSIQKTRIEAIVD